MVKAHHANGTANQESACSVVGDTLKSLVRKALVRAFSALFKKSPGPLRMSIYLLSNCAAEDGKKIGLSRIIDLPINARLLQSRLTSLRCKCDLKVLPQDWQSAQPSCIWQVVLHKASVCICLWLCWGKGNEHGHG